MAHNYEQSGGVRLGISFWMSFNLTYPFAKIDCSEEILVLKVNAIVYKREFAFSKSDVQLREFRGLFSRGIRILHKNKEYPEFILYWTTNMQELMENLIARGFDISK